MSENAPAAGLSAAPSQMRTLAVRIQDDLRAQLDVIAQLNDRTVTEEIRIALEAWVETSKLAKTPDREITCCIGRKLFRVKAPADATHPDWDRRVVVGRR
jgi:hypothetical protein